MAKKAMEPVKLESYFNDYVDDDNEDVEVEVIEEKENETDDDYDDYTDNYEDFNKIKEEVEETVVEKEVATTDVSKVQKHRSYKEVYRELDAVDDDYEDPTFNTILSFVSKWFSIIGVIIAIILIAYFIVTGQFQNLILYILGLVAAFFFGWFFMYFLVKFTENN